MSVLFADVFRPPDILVGGLRFYRDSSSSIYSSFFVGYPPSSLNGDKTKTKTDHMFGSERDLKIHLQYLGYPLQIGGPKATFFRRLRNLTATLTAYVIRTEHDTHNRASVLETTMGLLHCLKMS